MISKEIEASLSFSTTFLLAIVSILTKISAKTIFQIEQKSLYNPRFFRSPGIAARYIRNGRDLAEWVHVDVLFQAYFNAFLILNSIGAPLNAAFIYDLVIAYFIAAPGSGKPRCL